MGIISYEYEEKTLGIGGYEDDCHMTFDLDFGNGINTTLNELRGEHAAESMIWTNGEHGTSVHEAKLLDQVEEEEKQEDNEVAEIDSSEHVVNVEIENTVVVENTIIINNNVEKEPKVLAEPADGDVFYFTPQHHEAAAESAAEGHAAFEEYK